MNTSTTALAIGTLAAALLASPGYAAATALGDQVSRLAATERSAGDAHAAAFVERWGAARARGADWSEPALTDAARASNPRQAAWYEMMVEKIRRARHWLGDGNLYFDRDVNEAKLALARYELEQATTRDLPLREGLLRSVYHAICKRQFNPVPLAVPPPPAPPTAEIDVDPSRITRGEGATLTWSTANATEAAIDGEASPLRGSRAVRPDASRSWDIVATGAGGRATDRTRIEVVAPERRAFIIFFDFDKDEIRPDAADTLAAIARALRDEPALRLQADGHTDAKGENDYNQDLSDRRVRAAMNWLAEKHGVDLSKFVTRSHSEYQPLAPNENPDGTDNPGGRALNRRVQFTDITQ